MHKRFNLFILRLIFFFTKNHIKGHYHYISSLTKIDHFEIEYMQLLKVPQNTKICVKNVFPRRIQISLQKNSNI